MTSWRFSRARPCARTTKFQKGVRGIEVLDRPGFHARPRGAGSLRRDSEGPRRKLAYVRRRVQLEPVLAAGSDYYGQRAERGVEMDLPRSGRKPPGDNAAGLRRGNVPHEYERGPCRRCAQWAPDLVLARPGSEA